MISAPITRKAKMAKYANHYQYISKLRHILLASGTQGISQHELNQRSRTKVFTREHMLDTLEEWRLRDWVQAFKFAGLSKHPKTMWRATTRLRDDWSRFHLQTEPTEPVAQPGEQYDIFTELDRKGY